MDLQKYRAQLPALPVVYPVVGKNLDESALKVRSGFSSAEEVIADYRVRYPAERMRWFRRYYLKPIVRGGKATGNFQLVYVWNTKSSRMDRAVGIVSGEDLAAAKVLIGNSTPPSMHGCVRWDLCLDRDGRDTIALGRYDPWALLNDVTEGDLLRLAGKGLVPNLEEWDFDCMFMDRLCPCCGLFVVVNMFAFNIDTAQCCKCGVRPFLSGLVADKIRIALPEAGGWSDQNDQQLLGIVGYMGEVRASVMNLHQEQLPPHITVHTALKLMLLRSRLISQSSGGDSKVTIPVELALRLQSAKDGAQQLQLANMAAALVARRIDEGGPFSEVESKAAELLAAMDRESRR